MSPPVEVYFDRGCLYFGKDEGYECQEGRAMGHHDYSTDFSDETTDLESTQPDDRLTRISKTHPTPASSSPPGGHIEWGDRVWRRSDQTTKPSPSFVHFHPNDGFWTTEAPVTSLSPPMSHEYVRLDSGHWILVPLLSSSQCYPLPVRSTTVDHRTASSGVRQPEPQQPDPTPDTSTWAESPLDHSHPRYPATQTDRTQLFSTIYSPDQPVDVEAQDLLDRLHAAVERQKSGQINQQNLLRRQAPTYQGRAGVYQAPSSTSAAMYCNEPVAVQREENIPWPTGLRERSGDSIDLLTQRLKTM